MTTPRRTEIPRNEHIVIIRTITEYAVKVTDAANDQEAYEIANQEFDPDRHKRRDYTTTDIVLRPEK